MRDRRSRVLPTKALSEVPAEYERVFVEHGWRRAEYLFGVRAAQRYNRVLGAERLHADRQRFLIEQRR